MAHPLAILIRRLGSGGGGRRAEGRVYHGHDLTGLPAALDGRRRTGGAARVVYDSHELFMEAGTTARQAGWARRVLAYVEGRWIFRQVDGLITVNNSIAEELRRRYGAP